LVSRIATVTVGVVLLAGAIASLLGIGLVRVAAQSQARAGLARQATAVAEAIDRATADLPGSGAGVTGELLRALDVPAARVSAKGAVTGDRQAVAAVTAQNLAALGAGVSISDTATVNGHTILVEGRPLAHGGAVVLTRAVTDAVGPMLALLNRQLVALAVGVVAAGIAGLLLARWVAAPLRRVADGAWRLARGGRDVRVPPEGPAEVARVAESVNALADALAVSERREREFLLSVTHELRTPAHRGQGLRRGRRRRSGDGGRGPPGRHGHPGRVEPARTSHRRSARPRAIGRQGLLRLARAGEPHRRDGRRGDGVAVAVRRRRGRVHRGPPGRAARAVH
jgi:two-component system sensor histidine kinase BaeS